MKKLFKLTLSLLMALTVICGGMVVNTESAKALAESHSEAFTDVTYLISTSTVSPNVMTTENVFFNKIPAYIMLHDGNREVSIKGVTKKGYKVKLEVKEKGDVFIDYKARISTTVGQDLANAHMEVYSDSSCTTKVSSISLDSKNEQTTGNHCIQFTRTGTYYLAFYRDNPSQYSSDWFSFYLYEYSAENKTLTSGKWQAIAGYDSSTYGYRYYKFTVTEPMNVVITSDETYLYYDIVNSSKDDKYTGLCLDLSNNYKNYVYLYTGTYYIRTYGSALVGAEDGFGSLLKVTNYKLSSSSFSFSSSKTTSIVNLANSSAPLMYQFKPTKDGFIRVMDVYGAPSYITLCKSDRTAISGKNYLQSGGYIYYGVKAGNTYYIKINSSAPANKYEFKLYTVTDSSGSKFTAAKTMTAGTTYKGLIYANSSTKDYYRLKLTSKKKFKITIGVYSNSSSDGFIVKLYKADQSLISGSSMTLTGPKRIGSTITTTSAFPAGYYYIRIERKATTSSGSYTIKWNTVS